MGMGFVRNLLDFSERNLYLKQLNWSIENRNMDNYTFKFVTSKFKILTILFLLPSFALVAQDENPDLSTTSLEVEDDYKDTWRTPNITDEMTVDEEQNKSWRMGEYRYSAKPKNSKLFPFY